MPIALIVAAILLAITGIKGNYQAVGTQFQTTFFGGADGQAGFAAWLGAIFGLAIIFRLIQAPGAGKLFISLVLLAFMLNHVQALKGIEGALKGATTPPTPATPATPAQVPVAPGPAASGQAVPGYTTGGGF
jgi:hypothetical protein